VENIQKTVADYYKIKVADMYSKKRPASIARPRQIAMYLAKELTQKSLPEIGELFGGRDHTTVLHAVRKIAGERQPDRAEPAAARAGADPERLTPTMPRRRRNRLQKQRQYGVCHRRSRVPGGPVPRAGTSTVPTTQRKT
jgi:hypothetical protein